MLRKIKRNMARRQLENDGMKHLNKDHKRGSIFSMNWRKAYILRFAEVARKNGQKVEIISAKPESEDLPILISIEDDGSETFLVQSKDYKFAQFLAMIQNRCTLELINRILKEGLFDEADESKVNNLIRFCDLLYLWSKSAINIDDDILKTLKGENYEPDSDSK